MAAIASSIRDVLVILDAERRAADAAVAVARRAGAHLNAVALTFEALAPVYTVAAAPIPAELLVAAHDQSREDAERCRRDFERLAADAGISADARVADTVAGDGLLGIVGSCVLSDLAVISQMAPDRREPMRDVLIESLLFRARLPLLLLPWSGLTEFSPARAVVAWNGSATAAQALRAALPLLALAESVTVATVDEQSTELGGDEAVRYLARHGITAALRQIADPGMAAGQALLAFAAEERADWLAMGAYGHSRMREFLLGGATRHIIGHATLPVFMVH
jgi:nucleotide-binding universal stress UspA family protein